LVVEEEVLFFVAEEEVLFFVAEEVSIGIRDRASWLVFQKMDFHLRQNFPSKMSRNLRLVGNNRGREVGDNRGLQVEDN
jgi:hypothetical protein